MRYVIADQDGKSHAYFDSLPDALQALVDMDDYSLMVLPYDDQGARTGPALPALPVLHVDFNQLSSGHDMWARVNDYRLQADQRVVLDDREGTRCQGTITQVCPRDWKGDPRCDYVAVRPIEDTFEHYEVSGPSDAR